MEKQKQIKKINKEIVILHYRFDIMILQYITDDSGQKNAVLLPIKEWENLQKELKELQILRQYKEKYLFLVGLKEAIDEVKLHSEGKIKLQTAKGFLNEL